MVQVVCRDLRLLIQKQMEDHEPFLRFGLLVAGTDEDLHLLLHQQTDGNGPRLRFDVLAECADEHRDKELNAGIVVSLSDMAASHCNRFGGVVSGGASCNRIVEL